LFTSVINEELHKKQDANNDGILGWQELVSQVQHRVRLQSIAGSVPQFPTAGPRDLLDIVELPIAGSREFAMFVGPNTEKLSWHEQ
jgi:hypothetical protein